MSFRTIKVKTFIAPETFKGLVSRLSDELKPTSPVGFGGILREQSNSKSTSFFFPLIRIGSLLRSPEDQ